MNEKLVVWIKRLHELHDRFWSEASDKEDRMYEMGMTIAFGMTLDLIKLLEEKEVNKLVTANSQRG